MSKLSLNIVIKPRLYLGVKFRLYLMAKSNGSFRLNLMQNVMAKYSGKT
jgi:hypothetical protein